MFLVSNFHLCDGTEKVIKDLKRFIGYENGLIEISMK